MSTLRALSLSIIIVIGSLTLGVNFLPVVSSSSSPSGYLAGQLQDTGGNAVGGATIDIIDLDTATIVTTVGTDADGSFGPLFVTPGNYTAMVNGSTASTAKKVQVNVDETEQIHVTSGSSSEQLFGAVQNTQCQAVGGTAVDIIDLDTATLVTTVTTDADGSFGPLNISPGNYTATINGTTASTATKVQVDPDETERISVTYGSSAEKLTGRLRDSTGKTVGVTNVDIIDLDTATVVTSVTTDADGFFGPIDVAPGNYTVELPGATAAYASTVRVDADETENIHIVTNSSPPTDARLTGAVQDTAGNPAGGTTINVIDLDTGCRVLTAQADSTGTIGPVAVAPGNYTIEASGSTNATATNVRLSTGETEKIHATVGSTSEQLIGDVQDTAGNPAGNSTVDVIDLDAGTVVATVTTDADGSFGPVGIAPGNYTAETNGSSSSTASRVGLDAGETEKIHVTVGSTSEQLIGDVQDTAGNPVANTAVDVIDLDAGVRVQTLQTESDGTFGPAAFAPGNYTIEMNGSATQTASHVWLSTGETESIHVVTTASSTPTSTPTPTPTPSPTAEPVPAVSTPTATPTPTPSATPSPTPSPTATPPTPTPTVEDTQTAAGEAEAEAATTSQETTSTDSPDGVAGQTPGFGIGIAVLALLVSVMIPLYRARD